MLKTFIFPFPMKMCYISQKHSLTEHTARNAALSIVDCTCFLKSVVPYSWTGAGVDGFADSSELALHVVMAIM